MQSFTLPGESQKAAKILQHFLGQYARIIQGLVLIQ
jgi:hypothetical protein